MVYLIVFFGAVFFILSFEKHDPKDLDNESYEDFVDRLGPGGC